MGMAQLSIIGNLGRDPEMSYTPDGTAIVKFSVAVTRKTKDKESTTWFNCVAFRKQAETLNTYVRKGQQVYIQGEFVPREYNDRKYPTTFVVSGGKSCRIPSHYHNGKKRCQEPFPA